MLQGSQTNLNEIGPSVPCCPSQFNLTQTSHATILAVPHAHVEILSAAPRVAFYSHNTREGADVSDEAFQRYSFLEVEG